MKIDFQSFIKKWTRDRSKKFPTGSIVFKGFQGSGKTLSLVHYVLEIKKEFPKCLVYSNILLKDIEYIYIKNDYVLNEALTRENGENGIIILLDEAHLYFNKKSGIPLDVLTCISQQRKDRRRLCFTSQIWEELDVSLRKQVKEVVSCKNIFNKIQINTVSDGETITYNKQQSTWEAKKIRTDIFKHNDELYQRYDTRQKVLRNTQYERVPTAPSVVINTTLSGKNN